MRIIPKTDPNQGPKDWFTGKVTIQPLKPVSENSKLSMSSVRFEAGARAA